MRFLNVFATFLVFICMATCELASGNIVKTGKGLVHGRVINSTFVFQGIPYAQPPVGNLRYMAPVNMQPWNGTKGMMHYSNWCPQLTNSNVSMDEDCLYLNVFSPSTNGLFPVLVWIHGGGFTTGSGNRFPEASIINQIVSKGIVMVTLNYRLNGFGFFSTHTADITANLGMLDQVKALEWVHSEIKHFGGDPSKVTIDGESAGGASVALQTYSKLSRGYYHQVIMQSGTSRVPWAVDGAYLHSTGSMELAILAGCTSHDKWTAKNFTGLLACLQSKDWENLLNLQKNLTVTGLWLPVVDGKGGFLEDFPSKIKRTSNFSVIMGSNHDEMGFFTLAILYGKMKMSQINSAFFHMQAASVARGYFSSISTALTELINYAYVESQQFNRTDSGSWLRASTQLISELNIHAGTVAEAKSLLSQGQTVYIYSFDYASKALWGNFSYPAVLHFFDVMYLFPGVEDGLAWKFGPEDIKISNIFGEMWSNYVIYGNPTPSRNNSQLGFQWSPSSFHGSLTYLSIAMESRMEFYFHARAEGFWNVLLPQISRSLQPMQFSSTVQHEQTTQQTNIKTTTSGGPLKSTRSILTITMVWFLINYCL